MNASAGTESQAAGTPTTGRVWETGWARRTVTDASELTTAAYGAVNWDHRQDHRAARIRHPASRSARAAIPGHRRRGRPARCIDLRGW